MTGSATRRRWLRYRNRLIALMPGAHRLAVRTDFFLRHLPRLAANGWTAPLPPLLKRSFLRGIARDEHARILVETGTYLGDTTWWFRNDFERLYTVEVDPFLHEEAKHRFASLSQVEPSFGDSSTILSSIVPRIDSKALYWLDGHYSAGITGSGTTHCPVMAELEAIYGLAKVPFVVVIDDARCFGDDPSYPTVSCVRDRVATLSHGRDIVTVENDMILIRQPGAA